MSVEKRHSGIECLRVAAVFAVILIHTDPFETFESTFFARLYLVLYNVCLFAVPFFFIAAGYFFGRSLQRNPLPAVFKKYAARLISVFTFWCAFYMLYPPKTARHFDRASKELPWLWKITRAFWGTRLHYYRYHPLGLLIDGTRYHLWFLTALLMALALLTFFLALHLEKFYLPFSAALYAFAMAADSYVLTPIGLRPPMHMHWERGPFMSSLLVGLGWHFSQRQRLPSARFIRYLLLGGFVLQLAEGAALQRLYNEPPVDTVFGTVPFALGVFLWALSRPKMGEGTFWVPVARLSLGVYTAHVLVLDALYSFRPSAPSIAWEIGYPVVVFALTFGLVFLLSRVRRLRPYVC